MGYGLKFTLGGAPLTPHNVLAPAGGKLISNITPGEIVLLEDRGITLEQARGWSDDPSIPLELVEVDSDGREVSDIAKLTKEQLVTHAGKLVPPLVLDARSTKDELLAAIAAHEPAPAHVAGGDDQGVDQNADHDDAATAATEGTA